MKKYSPEVHKFIVENVKGTTTKDLAELVNAKCGTDFTESKMKSYKCNHGLKSGTRCGLPAGAPSKQFPAAIKKFIEANHVGIGPKEMTELLNKTFKTSYAHKQLTAYYRNHSLDSGLKGYFQKGHVPVNKGTKGVYGVGGNRTSFKKGHKSHNWVPIGSERISKDDYVQVKIQDGKRQYNWRGKHILIWEQHNGPLPKGHAVLFGDGDKRNFNINNLLLVSRAQLARLNQNGLIQNDADLTRTGIVIADVIQKIADAKRR